MNEVLSQTSTEKIGEMKNWRFSFSSPNRQIYFLANIFSYTVPDKESNPELHRLVTKYQMHKCSSYCKRTRGAFLTRCKFGFPRVETDEGKINNVEDCLKSRNKIYDLPRAFSKLRVNDYNPILLLL